MAELTGRVSSDTIEKARRLMSCAQIDSIRLRSCSAEHDSGRVSGVKPNRSLRVDQQTSSQGSVEGKTLVIVPSYELTGTREDEDRPEVSIRCSFELRYSVPTEVEPTSEEVQAFAETNAMLNSWPYWREFVQTTVARMNLPPLTLRLYRIVPIAPTGKVSHEELEPEQEAAKVVKRSARKYPKNPSPRERRA